ncbi:MAG: hypothetical protein H0W86_00220 [Armatimonadetes bacterium]|nr:hypothetical protein [Armatimonadota bacterium]
MRRILFASLSALVLSVSAAAQTDHDNIDSGRPLSFDDAEAIAYLGKAVEVGFAGSFFRNGSPGFEFPVTLIWGGMMDTQFEARLAARAGQGAGNGISPLDLSVLHSFRRETRSGPAMALKAEVQLPTERGDTASYRLRGIMTKAAGQYDRFHVNADVDFLPRAREGANKALLGAVLGYTKPIGYPRHFDTTGLAEIALRQAQRRGDGSILSAGIGVRRQMTPRSVLDIGLQSEIVTGRGSNSIPLRLILGYSTGF